MSLDVAAPAAGLRLWGLGTSRTLRPIWMMLELGLEWAQEEVLPRTPSMQGPAFRAVSPRGKVPILEDGALCIGESALIALYLADRDRERAAFAPAPGSEARARHDEICWFVMTEMDAILYTIRRHEGLPEIYGASAVAVEAARAYFLRSCAELESRLQDGRAYLAGPAFQVADLLAKTCLDWARSVCRIELSADLLLYSARIAERPAFIAAMKRNFTPAAMAALSGAPT